MSFESDQIFNLELMIDDLRNAQQEYLALSLNWDGGTTEELNNMNRTVLAKRRTAEELAFSAIEETLTARQWNTFEIVLSEGLGRKYGPLFDLVDGKLGDSLGLNNSLKSKVKSSAAKAKLQFEEDTRQIENSWLDSVFSAFDSESKEKLGKLLGPGLKSMPANLEAYHLGK